MSASSKKKLRKEQTAGQMTERQLAEQKEAKKLKLLTIGFTLLMVAILVIALTVAITTGINNSGILARNTTAVTIGEHEISNAELNYFYIDAINTFYNQYGSYASMFGLDVTAPLDQQVINEETGYTWADDFIVSAKNNAASIYALADEAAAKGHTLSEEELASIESTISTYATYATLYGYEDLDAYLKAMYGNGANEKSYREYCELSMLADSYYNAYGTSLTYDDAALREAEKDNFNKYSSFTYNYYYLAASKFLTGGTTDAEGNTTYSDEEKAASVQAAEDAAKALTGEDITSVEAFDAAISALSINAESETPVTSTLYTDNAYASINTTFVDWLADASRVAGNKTYIANETTSTDADGNEVTTVNGYYVLYYTSTNDNTVALRNVRHLLVAFEGGTTDSTTGAVTYSDDEKAAARAAAGELYEQWKSGDATEDSFAALANEHSDDGDGTTGGLYENVYPGQMVTNFEDWCFDETRKAGDTGIVETEYGYHIMYYVGESDTVYRDYMIENELRSADITAWYEALVEAMTVTDGNTSHIRTDLVLSSN